MTSLANDNPQDSARIPNDPSSLTDKSTQEDILNVFPSEFQNVIQRRQKILSSLAYFIGKDFQIPVELGLPGKGWYWDFENNVIKADPMDLLNKSMDYLRFVISHEGAHRRISRASFIPESEWNTPGFQAMMNSVEDCRVNNFTIESYPKFHEQMESAYLEIAELRQKAKEKAGKTASMVSWNCFKNYKKSHIESLQTIYTNPIVFQISNPHDSH